MEEGRKERTVELGVAESLSNERGGTRRRLEPSGEEGRKGKSCRVENFRVVIRRKRGRKETVVESKVAESLLGGRGSTRREPSSRKL